LSRKIIKKTSAISKKGSDNKNLNIAVEYIKNNQVGIVNLFTDKKAVTDKNYQTRAQINESRQKAGGRVKSRRSSAKQSTTNRGAPSGYAVTSRKDPEGLKVYTKGGKDYVK
jgi:hypothetical protein